MDLAERLGAVFLSVFPFPFSLTPSEHIKHPFTYGNKFASLDPVCPLPPPPPPQARRVPGAGPALPSPPLPSG